MMIEFPDRQQAWDLDSGPLIARVAAGDEVHVQACGVYAGALQGGEVYPYATLALVPEEQEAAFTAAIAQGGLGPGAGETKIGAVFDRFGGFAIYLPVDRRVVSVRAPFGACVFIYDAILDVTANGLVWTRKARPCGCKG